MRYRTFVNQDDFQNPGFQSQSVDSGNRDHLHLAAVAFGLSAKQRQAHPPVGKRARAWVERSDAEGCTIVAVWVRGEHGDWVRAPTSDTTDSPSCRPTP